MQNQIGYKCCFVWLWAGEKGHAMKKGRKAPHKTKY